MTTANPLLSPTGRVFVERWPTERLLFFLCVVLSIGLWCLIAISIVGLFYAAFFAVALVFLQAAFIAHVRGNGIRLSDEQFPELHRAVHRLADRLGMETVPAAYLMQAGGALNAFATKFFRSHFIVLYADLLEACGDNEAARDMIIAHELGHVKAGHLSWRWLIAPSLFVPFLGHALSRAREYTCDRYGLAGAGDVDGAILGLTILAAGGKLAPGVNHQAFLAQRADLNTGWMSIGQWLSTHPPLAKRVAQLDPVAGRRPAPGMAGAFRGAAIIAGIIGATTIGTVLAVTLYRSVSSRLEQIASTGEFQQMSGTGSLPPATRDVAALTNQVQSDLKRISALVEGAAAGPTPPAGWEEIEVLWNQTYPTEPLPVDPFDGYQYGFLWEDDGRFVLWSSGPDGTSGTEDDIVQRSGMSYTFPQ